MAAAQQVANIMMTSNSPQHMRPAATVYAYQSMTSRHARGMPCSSLPLVHPSAQIIAASAPAVHVEAQQKHLV
jgi:hypothetical protein